MLCPRCRTQLVEKNVNFFGNRETFLTCPKCGFTISREALEEARETICIQVSVTRRLPEAVRRQIAEAIASGLLRMVERIDLETGRRVQCIEYNDRSSDPVKARRLYTKLLHYAKTL